MEGPRAVAGAESQLGRHQRATEILVVLKQGDGGRRGSVVGLKAVAGEQSGFYIVELIIVLAPMGRAV